MEWAKEFDVSFVMLIGTLSMGLLSLSIIFFYILYLKKLNHQHSFHQKELLESSIQAQEIERKRFSEDLHDDIAATLSIIKMKLGEIGPPNLPQAKELTTMLEDAIQNTRKISWALSPVILENFGLAMALKQYVEKIKKDGLHAIFKYDLHTEKFNPKIEIGIYRIIQEMITNSIKHGQSSEIEIILKSVKGMAQVVFMDNGKKFDLTRTKGLPVKESGLGLKNIESRLSVINGTVEYVEDAKYSNKTIFTIPLN